jgi:uncharacterized OB-fold protein
MQILPKVDSLSAPYWEGTAVGELRLQHCLDCGVCWHPALPLCPACHSKAVEWRAATGRGVLYSFTDVHHAVHVAMADRIPYRVCLVDLAEGPRIVAGMDLTEAPPRIGQALRVIFRKVGDEVVLPYFQPD